MKPGFLLVQWAGQGSGDYRGSPGALGNEDSLSPSFSALVPNTEEPALSSAEGSLGA